MGLDMWVFGIKDISKDEIPDNMDESWYEEKGYNVIYKDENNDKEFEKMFNDLLPYSVKRNVRFKFIDLDKIKKDYNIPENYSLTMISSGRIYGFSYHGNTYEIDLSEVEPSKYDIYEFRESYIFKEEELAYWRKYYGLEDLIYREYNGEIFNCGFHLIDDNLMKKINNFLNDTQNINSGGYIAKMYHEWY